MRNAIISHAARLTDQQLLVQVTDLARCEREATVNLVVYLAELDERKLYLGEGCASLFSYCVRVLKLSEHAAYARIQAARVVRKFPVAIDKLVAGSVNLTTLQLLSPYLTQSNCADLLTAVTHKSKRETEELLAALQPRREVAAAIRRVAAREATPAAAPAPSPASLIPDDGNASTEATVGANGGDGFGRGHMHGDEPSAHSGAGATGRGGDAGPRQGSKPHGPMSTPMAGDRYRIHITVSAATHAKLLEAQELLRHQIPNGDPGCVIDRALTLLVAQLKKARFGAGARPARNASASSVHSTSGGSASGVHSTSGASAKSARSTSRASASSARSTSGDSASGPSSTSGGGVASGARDARRRSGAGRNGRRSRYIPVAVRRAVWARDGGRCGFTSPDGRRCNERNFLQFDHAIPHGDHGVATIENIQLRCRAHNLYAADLYFGPGTSAIRRKKSASRTARQPSSPGRGAPAEHHRR
jgi:hypothetical protein